VPGAQEVPTTAVALLTKHGKNATVFEPTMLFYYDCVLCSTCGQNYPHKVAEVKSATYYEYSMYCSGNYHRVQYDNAYVCCSR